jgi:hypothetical protein
MSGIAGNKAWWMIQKQTAKGTPATPILGTTAIGGAYRLPFSGGSLAVNRVFGKLAETDASRDQGVSFAKVGGLAGTPEAYVRADSFAGLASYALGANTDGGTTPKFTHTATAGTASPPYITVWNGVGETLYEQYQDCFINSLQVKTTAGEPLTAAMNILGIKTTRLTTDPSVAATIPLQTGYAFNFNDVDVELSGGVVHTVSSFDMTITNAVTVQQTDNFSPHDVVAGIRTVDLTFDMVFENLTEYNKFNFGEASGTAESNKLYKTSAKFIFAPEGSEEKIEFELPTIAYETFPIVPNVAGTPIVVSVKAVAQRPTGSEKILTIITTNPNKLLI